MLLALITSAIFAAPAAFSKDDASTATLITGARIFDGISENLLEGQDVLVKDGVIAQIAKDIDAPAGATVINAEGRVLTPGLVFMHEHLMMQLSSPDLLFRDDRYKAIVAGNIAEDYLERGITTVRDASGNTYGLKAAIDDGQTPGPRIYPSGPMISQTSGHSDHRFPTDKSVEMGGHHDLLVSEGDFVVADGVPEMLTATRENLRRGSSQIKIAVGGGTGSVSDPLEVVEFTDEEIQAATKAASDFGTYTMAHVYNNEGVRRAIDNGVKSIEHGNLIDKDTLQYIKDQGDVWLSPQVSVYTFIPAGYTEGQAHKHHQAFEGIDHMFKTAKEIGFDKIVIGSDIISNPEAIAKINEEFTFRAQWFSPIEVMRQATSKGGELLELSGVLNPYPGKLGVIAQGAHADLLLIDGNPLEDLSVMTDHEANFDLIMKGGEIYKSDL
ncbi:amidohydrolase family protein [Alginatibacterium sediminis]|uniref:Amidohydrolase family protein n=2 Tax=Alginatibacterium sediminis TaxID=2164068 RepID=A0A420EBV8_9ALTE|nr:amidohydrolase family protein [Alginatibacterium sediminis]